MGLGEKAAIGLGSNLGDRPAYLQQALKAVDGWKDTSVVAVSSLWETDPVGPQDQDLFLNAAALAETSAEPLEFLDRLLDLELKLDRVRTRHWGPRTIDLDLLLWGSRVLESQRLNLPHPELADRAFVLVPLAEVAGGAVHPVLKQTVLELRQNIDDSGVHLYQKGAGWSGLSL